MTRENQKSLPYRRPDPRAGVPRAGVPRLNAEETDPIRIFLLLGYRLLADVIKTSLESCHAVTLIGIADDPKEALLSQEMITADILLIDSSMGRERALQTVRSFSQRLPQLKILSLGLERKEDIVDFIEAGTVGYVAPDSSFDDLLRLIEATHRGEALVSPRVVAAVFARVAELAQKRSERPPRPWFPEARLTLREQQVLRLVAFGHPNKAIAQQLEISVLTVKNHVHKILEKLKVAKRREAIRMVREHALMLEVPACQLG